jgi:hypothetical protein
LFDFLTKVALGVWDDEEEEADPENEGSFDH